jgi:outer membrane protein assembly factor BamA
MPRKYSVQITPGNFGQASIVTAAGADIAGHHAFLASITTEFEKPEFQGDLQYTYGRLPFDVNVHLFRSIVPRNDFQLGQSFRPIWVEEDIGAETGIGYAIPHAFDAQAFSITYSAVRTGGDIPVPASKLDPYETPSIPQRGMLAALHFGWSYSNEQGYLWGVGPEKGISVGAGFDWSDSAIASQYSGYAVNTNIVAYFLMPWLRHHSLAMHAGGGTGGGNLGTHGLYYVGGFVDFPLVNTVQNTLIQSSLVLRGYPTVALEGRSFALFNAEYRFPIVNVDRGLSTLPLFLNRINGALFVDYGSAFDDPEQAHFKTGAGGELWFDFDLGYIVPMTFRAGYAKGLASGGTDKTYFVAAVPF